MSTPKGVYSREEEETKSVREGVKGWVVTAQVVEQEV